MAGAAECWSGRPEK